MKDRRLGGEKMRKEGERIKEKGQRTKGKDERLRVLNSEVGMRKWEL